MLIVKKAAPRGLPTCRSVLWSMGEPVSGSEVFSLNSCVTAIPMDVKASDVRSQARNVRSVWNQHASSKVSCVGVSYQERGDREPRSPCSPTQSTGRAPLPYSKWTVPWSRTVLRSCRVRHFRRSPPLGRLATSTASACRPTSSAAACHHRRWREIGSSGWKDAWKEKPSSHQVARRRKRARFAIVSIHRLWGSQDCCLRTLTRRRCYQRVHARSTKLSVSISLGQSE